MAHVSGIGEVWHEVDGIVSAHKAIVVRSGQRTQLDRCAELWVEQPFPLVTHVVAEIGPGYDADQASVLFVSLEVFVAEPYDIPPRHERGVTDWWVLEAHPHVGSPFLWFRDIDEDRFVWNLATCRG